MAEAGTPTVNTPLTPPPEDAQAEDAAASSAAADAAPKSKRGPGRPKGSRTRTPAQKAAWSKAQAARRAGVKAPAAPRPASAVTDAELAKAIDQLYGFAGMGIGFAGLTDVGMAVATCQPGKAWVNLSRSNPALRRALESLAGSSALGELLMAHAPLFALVMAKVNPAMAGMASGPPQPPQPDTAYTNGASLGDDAFPLTAAQRHAAAQV